MRWKFAGGNLEPSFTLFGPAHLATLGVIGALCLAVPQGVRVAADRGLTAHVARFLAALLLCQEVIKLWVFVGIYDLPLAQKLPLDLCRLNAFLCAAMLLKRSYSLFEIAYFWTMAGSVAAMLTPDLPYGFPHPLFVIFFLSHALVVLAVVFAIFAYRFKPTLKSVGKAFAVSLLYMAIIMPVNYLLDTNYFYLRAKPPGPSALDLFGPWPWYVIVSVFIGRALFFICYAPFAVLRFRHGTRPR